uniref:Uncharacterized protein n=1 Tax=Mus musculus TaxID=10090 RepID=Q8C736_MOUSE|nr:unnamed protein product [Mus musculus]
MDMITLNPLMPFCTVTALTGEGKKWKIFLERMKTSRGLVGKWIINETSLSDYSYPQDLTLPRDEQQKTCSVFLCSCLELSPTSPIAEPNSLRSYAPLTGLIPMLVQSAKQGLQSDYVTLHQITQGNQSATPHVLSPRQSAN